MEIKKQAINKLKNEFAKANNMEKVIINNCLLVELENNLEFANKIMNEKKSIKDMASKISSWVRTSKNYAPSHDVVFSLALHYWVEDKPEYIKELTQEKPIEFGVIDSSFNNPIITKITGTVIKEVIKQVEKSTGNKVRNKEKINKKVAKEVKDQLNLFDILE